MNKRINIMLAAASTLAIIAGSICVAPAEARHCGGWKYGVNKRQRNQQRRLNQGLQSGQLTGREYGRLERREGRIAQQEYRMRHDGNGLQPWERAKLEREQSHLSKNIYNQKHDNQYVH